MRALVPAAIAAALALPLTAPAPAAAAKKGVHKKRCKPSTKAAQRRRARKARYCARRRGRPKRSRDSVVPWNPVRTPPGTTPVSPSPPAPGQPLARYVSVAAREWSLTLSRPVVAAGSVTIELRNVGEDPHDLVLSPEAGHEPLANFPETGPGGLSELQVNVAAGRYRLWCSLAGHEAAGMSALLRVGG